MQVTSPIVGWIWLLVFFLVMFSMAYFTLEKSKTKENFLVADRSLGLRRSSFSIAATWIWAPALFIAAQLAYQKGWVGLFWFLVPNILCLVIFSEFAYRFREKLPEGFTLSEYMLKRFSERVQNLYMVELLGLAICSFAVQLLAGGLIFSTLTGIPFMQVTIAMSAIALSYSIMSGISASVLTDHIQYIIIALAAFIFVPWVVINAGGFDAIRAGWNGVSGQYTSLFSGSGASVFFSFGLATTIGLLAGPFGDQTFWQRAQSTKKEYVRRAFVFGAIAFGVIPLFLSGLGFVMAGTTIKVGSAQLVNLQAVLHYLPQWTAVPFVFMLLCGLVSTLDSALCAISSIAGGDIADRVGSKNPMLFARVSMIVAVIGALIIANVPGMQILYLFLFYGTLRASVLIPTVMTLLSEKIAEAGVFWGILLSIGIGLPIFAYGNFNKISSIIVLGSLITVCTSGLVTYVVSRRMKA